MRRLSPLGRRDLPRRYRPTSTRGDPGARYPASAGEDRLDRIGRDGPGAKDHRALLRCSRRRSTPGHRWTGRRRGSGRSQGQAAPRSRRRRAPPARPSDSPRSSAAAQRPGASARGASCAGTRRPTVGMAPGASSPPVSAAGSGRSRRRGTTRVSPPGQNCRREHGRGGRDARRSRPPAPRRPVAARSPCPGVAPWRRTGARSRPASRARPRCHRRCRSGSRRGRRREHAGRLSRAPRGRPTQAPSRHAGHAGARATSRRRIATRGRRPRSSSMSHAQPGSRSLDERAHPWP